jgi:hypothetical protein
MTRLATSVNRDDRPLKLAQLLDRTALLEGGLQTSAMVEIGDDKDGDGPESADVCNCLAPRKASKASAFVGE